ncbi:VOC family protein [Streptomyces sp. HUAS MG47]|uniref:VOC family protein n=1 Tax=Streptomyces solicamelliae TaxID=3231716 RepID=UPI0038783F4E
MAVQPVPAEYPRITPYLCIDGAAAAIDFYVSVLGAEEKTRMPAPGGKIGHAEIALGNSIVMLADEYPDMDFRSPKAIGGTPLMLHAYVEDVDAVFAKALAQGARELRPVRDEFYGDRVGQFEDPFGHRWSVASHIEDVSEEEMRKRAAEVMGGMDPGAGNG